MYEFLKYIALKNNWIFNYARSDYQNLLHDVEEDKTYLFLDPVQIQHSFDEFQEPEVKTYNGTFLILQSSDFDGDYDEKYLKHIKPLIDNHLKVIQKEFSCSQYTVNQWNTTEIINLFDQNLDGILVNYSVEE